MPPTRPPDTPASPPDGGPNALFALFDQFGAVVYSGVPLDVDKAPIASVPTGREILNMLPLVDQLRPGPERHWGTLTAQTLASFFALAHRFKLEHQSIIAVDQVDSTVPPVLTARLNYHEPSEQVPVAVASDDTQRVGRRRGEAKWGDFAVEYRPAFDVAWRRWLAASQKEMDARTFAAFIEDAVTDLIADPGTDPLLNRVKEALQTSVGSPSDVFTVSRGMSVHMDHQVQQVTRLEDGSATITFKQDVVSTTVNSAPVKVPTLFAIEVPVLRGEAAVVLPVRLRFRVSNGTLLWSLHPYRPDLVVDAAVKAIVSDVWQFGEAAAIPVIRGRIDAITRVPVSLLRDRE